MLGIDCVNIERLILAADICQKDFEFAEVKLLTSLTSSQDQRIVKIKPINSTEEYSKFVIAELDKFVDTTHVLVIQYDGFILNPSAWSDEFIEYDYIGAPWIVDDWSVELFDFPIGLVHKMVVGNGGFSLRSKKLTSLCAELARQDAFKRYHPEDAAICVYDRKLIEKHGIKFAPVPLAQRFSFESEDEENDKWNGQFGFHGLSWTDISIWLQANPQYKDKIANDIEGHKLRMKQGSEQSK